jgi:hypothetical protein
MYASNIARSVEKDCDWFSFEQKINKSLPLWSGQRGAIVAMPGRMHTDGERQQSCLLVSQQRPKVVPGPPCGNGQILAAGVCLVTNQWQSPSNAVRTMGKDDVDATPRYLSDCPNRENRRYRHRGDGLSIMSGGMQRIFSENVSVGRICSAAQGLCSIGKSKT